MDYALLTSTLRPAAALLFIMENATDLDSIPFSQGSGESDTSGVFCMWSAKVAIYTASSARVSVAWSALAPSPSIEEIGLVLAL